MKRNVKAGRREGKSDDGGLEEAEDEVIGLTEIEWSSVEDRQTKTKSRVNTSKTEASLRWISDM